MAGDIIYQVSSAVLTVFLLVTSTSGQEAKELDVKLSGGGHSFQGYVEVYHDDTWHPACKVGWTREASDLVCQKLGLLGKAMTTISDKNYVLIERPGSVVKIDCYSNHTSWEQCIADWDTDCSSSLAVKVECALPNYVGCFPVSGNEYPLKGKVLTELDDLTIGVCLSECREEGFVYSGLVSSNTCFCGSAGEELDPTDKLTDSRCTAGCSGSGLQACGGHGRNAAAIYDVSIGNCGGRIKAKEGVIASPGFPENYSSDNPKVCHWVIDLSENGDTVIEFPMFDLDPNASDEVALSEDDGKTWSGYTSSTMPDKIVTSYQTLRLRFTIIARNGGLVADNVENSKGFLMSFTDGTACDPVDVYNGTLVLEDGKVYRPQDRVQLSCEDGYLPNYAMILCKSTGQWFPIPKCEEGRSMMPSRVFTTTILYLMITIVGVLGFIIFTIICAMLCIRSEKKCEGYKGISSGESGYQRGPDDLDERDHKMDMQDGPQDDGMDGMDMMHSNEQAIPLATASADL